MLDIISSITKNTIIHQTNKKNNLYLIIINYYIYIYYYIIKLPKKKKNQRAVRRSNDFPFDVHGAKNEDLHCLSTGSWTRLKPHRLALLLCFAVSEWRPPCVLGMRSDPAEISPRAYRNLSRVQRPHVPRTSTTGCRAINNWPARVSWFLAAFWRSYLSLIIFFNMNMNHNRLCDSFLEINLI